MDGKGRWIGNAFHRAVVAEREVPRGLSAGICERSRGATSLSKYFTFYDTWRVKETLG